MKTERQMVYEHEQKCRAMLELSQQPGFQFVLDALQETSEQAKAPFPNSVDSEIAFKSCAIVRATVDQIFATLHHLVSEGKRLTELEDQGEDPNGETGHIRRRRC